MKKIEYEDGSFCLETSSGATISNSTLGNLDKLLTNTRFEKMHYLCMEGFDNTDAEEILDFIINQ